MKHTEKLNGRLVLLAGAIAVFASSGAVRAGALTLQCTDCPLRIPEVGTYGTTISTLTADAWGRIVDVDVFVDLRHTFVGDLDIFILGPNGTSVQLFDNFGFSGDDVQEVFFDDEAAVSIRNASPPFGPGSFRPAPGALADFDGWELHGDWTLRIVDRFIGDSGTLRDWGLRIQSVPEPSSFVLLFAGGVLFLVHLRSGRRRPRRGAEAQAKK